MKKKIKINKYKGKRGKCQGGENTRDLLPRSKSIQYESKKKKNLVCSGEMISQLLNLSKKVVTAQISMLGLVIPQSASHLKGKKDREMHGGRWRGWRKKGKTVLLLDKSGMSQ